MEARCDVGLDELCPVCGDKGSGYHYGLFTCESCKGFFKRTVQNNKTYTCVENQRCRIDKAQRKRCPFCRFQKCLHVGMRLEAVRSDRMRGGRNEFGPMYKLDRALKQQKKALIQAARLGLDSSSSAPTSSSHHPDLSSAGGLHPVAITEQPSSMSALLSSSWPAAVQHQWTCPRPAGFAAGLLADPHEPVSRLLLEGPRMPELVVELLRCDPDELQLQKKISARLQEQTSCSRNSDSFGPLDDIADQLLCCIVEWARTSFFFKQLKVSDQMKLLHHCWSDLLVLDIISRLVLHGEEGSLLLVTGQEVDLSNIISGAGPALTSLTQRGQELVERLNILKVDRQEFACIKFLILFNPDGSELEQQGYVGCVQEQVKGALLEYTRHPGRFTQLLRSLSELRCLGSLLEDFLYWRHQAGAAPCNNLLNEMLHAKHSSTHRTIL